MVYRIERRGRMHAVVDDDGTIESVHAARAAAVERIEAIGRAAAQPKPKGTSGSSLHRRNSKDPEVLRVRKILSALQDDLDKAKGNTEARYQAFLYQGIDGKAPVAPGVAAEYEKRRRRALQSMRAAVAAKAARKRGDDSLCDAILKLKTAGHTTVEIATQCGCDDSYVRRIVRQSAPKPTR